MANVEPDHFRFTSYRKLIKFNPELGDFGFFPSLESCNTNELVIGIDHVGSLQCCKISDLDKSELSFDVKGKNDPLPAQSLLIPKSDPSTEVVFVGISCDDEFVAVVHSKKPDYVLSCYILDGLTLLCTVPCGKHFPRCLKFNPVVSNSFAIAFSSGHVQVCQIGKGNVGRLMDKMLEATAICWSPKGKQILVGTTSGLVLQITPQGDIKRTVQSPQIPTSWIQEIVWISTFHFICAVSQDPDVAFYSVSLQKDVNQPPVVEEIPDVLMSAISVPDTANLHVFMKYIPEWKLILCACSKSSDIAVIANLNESDKWVVMMLDENARAQLPIPKDSNDDSLCVGLCLNFCSTRKLQRSKSQEADQEWPLLLARSQYGYVYAYSIIYEGFSGNQNICVQPKGFQNLSLKSANTTPNVNLSQPTDSVDVNLHNMPVISNESGLQFNKQPVDSAFASFAQKTSEQTIKGAINNPVNQGLEVKSLPAKSKADTRKAIENLLRLFEEDLKTLAENTGNRAIANNRSLADLQLRTSEMEKFKNELKIQLESLARDVQMLKNAHLHTFNVVNRTKSVNERNSDTRYQSFLKSAPLAPDLQKLSESIQASKAFIELRSSEILALIDNLNWKQKKEIRDEAEYYENLNAILNNNYRTIMAMGQKVDGLVAKYDGKIDSMSNMRMNLSDKVGMKNNMFPKMSGLSILDLNRSLKDLDLARKVTKGQMSSNGETVVDLPSERISEVRDFLSRRTKVPMNKVPQILAMTNQSAKSDDLKYQTDSLLDNTDNRTSSEVADVTNIHSQREARVKMLENLRESVFRSQQPPSDKDAPVVNVKDLNMMQSMNPGDTINSRNLPVPNLRNSGLTLESKPQPNASSIFSKTDGQKPFIVAKEPPKYDAQATDLKPSASSVSSNPPILFNKFQKPEGLGFVHKSASGGSIFSAGSQGSKTGGGPPILGTSSSSSSLLNINGNQQGGIGGGSNAASGSALGIDLPLPSNSIVSSSHISLNRPNVSNLQSGNQSAFSVFSNGDQNSKTNTAPNTSSSVPISNKSILPNSSSLPKYDTLKTANAESTIFPNQAANKGLQFVENQDLNDSGVLKSSSSQQNSSSRTALSVASSSLEKTSQPFTISSSTSAANPDSSTLSVPSHVFGKPLGPTLSQTNKNESVPNVTLPKTEISTEKNISVLGFGAIPKPEKSTMGFSSSAVSKDSHSGVSSVGIDNNTVPVTPIASKETSNPGYATVNPLGFDNTPKISTSVFDKPSLSLFPPPASSALGSSLGQKTTVATGLASEKPVASGGVQPLSSSSSAPNLGIFPNSTAPQNTASVAAFVKPTEVASQAVTPNVTAPSNSNVESFDVKADQKQTPVSLMSVPSGSSSPKATVAVSAALNVSVSGSTGNVAPSQANSSAFPNTSVPSSVPNNAGLSLFGSKDDGKGSSIFGTATPSVSAPLVSTANAINTTPKPASIFGQMPASVAQVSSSPFGSTQGTASIFTQNQQNPVSASGWLNAGSQQNVSSSPFGQITPTANATVPKTIFGQTGNIPFQAGSTTQHSSPFGQPSQTIDTGSLLCTNAFAGLGSTQSNMTASSNPFGSPFGNSNGMSTANMGSSPFGQTSSLTSTTPQNSVFGNSNNSPFGQSLQSQGTASTVFGKPNAGPGSVFGGAQTANSQGSIFGQSGASSAFGASQASTTIFGKTPAPAFGQAAAFGSGPSFGGGAVFGAGSAPSVFNKNGGSTGGVFGSQSATSNMPTFGGLVGGGMSNQTAAFGGGSAQVSSPFGAAGSAFGGPMSGTTSAFGGTTGSSFSSWR